MGRLKCGCITADFKNSSDVRRGIAMSGGLLKECAEHSSKRESAYAAHLASIVADSPQGMRNRIDALEAELAQARAECERLMKLVMAVGNKYPGESRYDTAMRYIVEAETRASGPGQSAARKEGT